MVAVNMEIATAVTTAPTNTRKTFFNKRILIKAAIWVEGSEPVINSQVQSPKLCRSSQNFRLVDVETCRVGTAKQKKLGCQ